MENGQKAGQGEDAHKEKPATEEVKTDKQASDAEKKIDDKPEPTPELLEKIKKQVEFYFGDVNMRRDKFLIEQAKLDDGWIPMSIMLKFKMLASITTDADIILKALEGSELMEVSEDKRKIRRSTEHPLPVYDEEYRKALEAKTIYMKGFPLVETNIEKLKTFLDDYEPYENIIMRKYQDKEKKLQFKGSIFVQFNTLDDAKAFMARESIKYGDAELIRKWSVEYAEEKGKEKEELRKKRAERKEKKNDNRDKNAEEDGNGDGEEGGGQDNEPDKDSGLPKGSVIHFDKCSPECTREAIKEVLGKLEAPIAFVDFKKGDVEGWIRLHGENSAKPVVEKMTDGKITLAGTDVACRILEGEEETKYLAKVKEEMVNSRNKYKGKPRKGRNFVRGKKRPNQRAHDAVPSKRTAV